MGEKVEVFFLDQFFASAVILKYQTFSMSRDAIRKYIYQNGILPNTANNHRNRHTFANTYIYIYITHIYSEIFIVVLLGEILDKHNQVVYILK